MAIQIHYWSSDVEKALAHYVSVLGFELAYRQPDDAPADFCILKLGDAQIMIGLPPVAAIEEGRNDAALIQQAAERVGSPGPISVYIQVADIEVYHNSVQARGAEIVEPLWATPWGLKQFSVKDCDGNLTTFHN